MRKPEYLVGVDLGQTNDYTAVSILYRSERGTSRTERQVTYDGWSIASEKRPATEGVYEARYLERFPLGTPYPKQVERIRQIMSELEQRGDVRSDRATTHLVVDQTGVGRPVVDMLRAEGMRSLTAVTIHGGDQTIRDGSEYRVPKRELVSVVQVLLQTERLGIASSLPEAHTLTREMLAFKVEISKSGHDTYGNDWRENPHDDLVLSVSLAAWAGERIPRAGMRIYTHAVV